MTAEEKHVGIARRLEEPPRCHCGDQALWSKSHWLEPKKKEKKKDRIIIEAPHVLCECGVKANYGLVPLELGMGHWCGHQADYDEVGYCCWKHEIDFFFRNDL